jgi:predicted AlkP superfamily pyrophosphatase or phosphodiesterase
MPRSPYAVAAVAAAVACAGLSSPQQRPAAAAPGAVVLISIDGFRSDYIQRPAARNLRALAARGVRAEWMTPVFPSKTYPSHYTMVTGRWPEHHGVVANTMWDSEIGYTFEIGNRQAVADPRWWGDEPIWVAVERQGRRAAAFFWPGTETAIDGVRPTWWRRYDGSVPIAQRVAQLLEWLSLPADSAPLLVTTYFGEVDRAGHDFGPDAPQTSAAIGRVDSAIGALVHGLEHRGLAGKVNLVVVSDHGMAAVGKERIIYLDDYLDLSQVEVIDWSPVAALAPRAGTDAEAIYARLHGRHPRLTVYRRDDIPERYHYRAHPRIAPIIALADDGWQISSRPRAAASTREERGSHGYDPTLPSMRALFVADGPAFRSGAVVAPFGNVHVYALLCEILRLRPAVNDGALDSVRAMLR